MSNQSSYSRNGNNSRPLYPSHASLSNTDPGLYGSTREMGPPPPLEFPPQPVEIDLNNSRTLPSPSSSSSTNWDSTLFQPHGFGDMPYGSSSMAKMQQIPMEGQIPGAQQNPLVQWYTGNDGPWIPKVIPDAVPEERHTRGQIGNRNPMPFGGQYRQTNQSEAGSFQYGAPHSDSGYGTRRSVENASVFSAEVTERDQDCQSLVNNVAEYSPFGLNEVLQTRDARSGDSWPLPVPSSSISNSASLVCPSCHKPVKTRSELKKHDLRHSKPFVCQVSGCSRTEGFSTTNDLDRHTKSKHPSAIPESAQSKKYRCHVPGCKSKEKSWPRLDNFRSHLKRVHSHQLRTDEDFDEMIRRAEFWESTALNIDQDDLSPPKPSLPDPSRMMVPVIHNSLPRPRKMEPDWKRGYPDVMEPSQETVAPNRPQLEDFKPKVTSSERKTPVSELQQQHTVKPLEVIRSRSLAGIQENRIPLESVLAPVGHHDSAVKKPDRASSQPGAHPPKANPQAKATGQTDVSAADATIFEAIKTVLAGASIPDLCSGRNPNQVLERSGHPNGQVSSGGSWLSEPNPATSSTRRSDGLINPVGSPSTKENSRDSETEKKALEVLKILHDIGCLVQKDPSHSPKPQNPGSAASNKSENQVTCPTCKKFKGRPCELKKHMKRHERPYGCTFLTCNKTFGSKNDWKRHENSQHFHLETWRCDEEKLEGGACAKVCYRRQTFQDHLKKEHHMEDNDTIKNKVETCRIGRNCQARFWCGFCIKLINLQKKGLDAWTERFDHIDDHFMGRHDLKKQSILDWIPVDSDKPKGDVESPHSLNASPGKESQEPASDNSAASSPNGSSPESTVPGGSSANAATLEGGHQDGPKRRRASSDDDDSRSPKHAKTSKLDLVVYCCQCKIPHNPKWAQTCSNCDDSHRFCTSCITEYAAGDTADE